MLPRFALRPTGFVAAATAVFLSAGVASWLKAADPTADQQYWLELMNRMRTDPAGELERLTNYSVPGSTFANPASDNPYVNAALQFYGTSASELATQWASLVPAPALAWNGTLADSAATYSNVMATLDQQAHNLDGNTLVDRVVTNGGYSANYLEIGESLFATTQDPFHGHAAFAIDWGDSDTNPGNGFGTGIQSPASHRDDLMFPEFKEVGIGFQTTSLVGNVNVTGPLVTTQHFASSFRVVGQTYVADAYITGSIYTDAVLADSFYTPGEGVAGITVNIYDDATNTLLKTGTTNSAGGYNILLDGLTDGTLYRVEAPGSGDPAQTFSIDKRIVLYPTGNPADPEVPVTYYDNVYQSFQVVPEPAGCVLLLSAGATFFLVRRRNV